MTKQEPVAHMDTVRGKEITPTTIWMCRQNIPELVVQDAINELGLNEQQAERLRMILLYRGVNKWLYARRLLIDFKHKVKDRLNQEIHNYNDPDTINLLHWVNAGLQNIAKLPRWVEWPKTVTHDWSKIEREIVVKGRRT